MIINNFTLEQFACGRRGEYRIEHRFVPKTKSAAIHFGITFHVGLAAWYKTHDPAAALWAIKEAWGEEFFPEDHRTMQRCLAVMADYIRKYPSEGWRIVGFPDAPIVETAFTIDTGLRLPDGEAIEYGGILDGLFEANGQLFVLDHKTTSQLGATYFNQFKPNNQISGYVWGATQLSSRHVAGALINAVGVLKTQTKLERAWITRSGADIAEFLDDVNAAAHEIWRMRQSGQFPKRTTQCITKYGACMYHQVCSLPGDAKMRMRFLQQEYDVEKRNHERRDAVG